MGILKKLVRGLGKTRQKLLGGLKSILAGRQLTPELLEEIEATLIQADIGVQSTTKLCADLNTAYQNKEIQKGEDVIEFLKQELKSYWPEADRSIKLAESGPTVILVAGINGCGKTTSVAKLAWNFKKQGKRVMLAAADTFRAAAVEQLTVWANRIDCDIVKHENKGDPAAVAFDACKAAIARDVDVLIVDTAGRVHTEQNLMAQLVKIRNVITKNFPDGPHETLLVLDGTTGQNAISQATEFMKSVDVTGIVLAKLDGTAKGGIVVAIRNQIELPVKFIGVGETFEDIEPFDPDTFIEALFE